MTPGPFLALRDIPLLGRNCVALGARNYEYAPYRPLKIGLRFSMKAR
jgi:hypothetical protein